MSATALILLALAAVAVLLALVIWVKIPAFIALLIVSVLTALVAGVSPDNVIPLVMDGLGGTLGNVALLVGLGAMLGGIVERTGGAEVLAETFTAKLGPKRTGPALLLASSIVAIPIFFDVAFIILIPIIYSFSKAAKLRSPMLYGLPLAVMLFIHVMVPPHPGIAGSAATIGADVGVTTIVGLLICIPVGVVGYLVSRRICRKEYQMVPQTQEAYDNFGSDTFATPNAEDSGNVKVATRKPKASAVIFSVMLPVLMIAVGTVGNLFITEATPAYRVVKMIGTPAFALLVSNIVAMLILGLFNGWRIQKVADIMDNALGPAAVVVFVTGAGGVFAKVLTKTGIGDAISSAMIHAGIPILPLAFLLAAALRAAQGSATVSAITTAGLLASTVASSGFSPLQVVLLNLAIGTGAICLSHINDSGFWIVTRYLGLSVSDGLRTWTVLVTIMGVVGFVIICGLWLVV